MKKNTFKVKVITLFPEIFPGSLDISVIKRARQKGIWSLSTTDLKSFAYKKRKVDDKPYGGGAGSGRWVENLQKNSGEIFLNEQMNGGSGGGSGQEDRVQRRVPRKPGKIHLVAGHAVEGPEGRMCEA